MYKDLSLKEKSALFKLMVSNGITDINEIEKIYNKYDDGGNKISVNNLPESEQYAVTTPDGQRKVFNNKEEAQAYITANTPKDYSLYDTTNYGSNIDKGQTAILDRNTEREIEKATEEEIKTNARKANIESNKGYAMEALNAMPIIGDGMDIYSIVKDAYNKNYGNAALTAGMMVFPFDKFLKPVGKGIKKLFTKSIKSSKDINAKNLQNITNAEWDKLYNKAIKNNDLEEAQKLRDLHFKQKTPNNKVINKQYHVVGDNYDSNFTIFDPKENHTSIYTTDNMDMASSYSKYWLSNEEKLKSLNNLREKDISYKNKIIKDLQEELDYRQNNNKSNNYKYESTESLKARLDIELKDLELLNDDNNFQNYYNFYNTTPQPNRVKKLNIYLKNPIQIDNGGNNWNNIRISNLPKDVYDNIKVDRRSNFLDSRYSTLSLENVSKDLGYDGVIIDNITDYGKHWSNKYINFDIPNQVVITNDKNKLKLADAITYDDNGNIIPLSKRDNFNNPDIRYSWLLPTIGVGTGLSLINNNENNQYKYGGFINKYDGTSTKTQQMQTMEKPAFFEGDTWKPQYWFTPEYENATLKGAITQAYEDGNYGKDIIWNGRAYKAILNEEDANEYRKKKGIPLGEPIVNTANIQTNEKQPREYVSNSYIPVTSGNKIYYWDSYSGKFFEDAKGKTPTSKDYNTLLKDYYDQNISPALKENRYEDLIKLYVQQFRNLQARRRVSAREQDIPSDYGKRTIPITTGRSGSSRLPYPTDLIDSLSNHLQEGQSIYQALALPYKETEFGNRVNFESDVMGNRGHVLATLNDERYELPDQTFYSGLSYPLRAYFRNNKVDGKVDGMTQENFVKHYLASSENDLLDLKNLFNNKELLKYVGETLKKDLTKSRFVSFMNTNTEDNPNIYEHALSLLASGKYNPGEPGYNKGINKIAKQLENDPELNNYIDKHKIKKVGEKKK